MVGWTPLNVLVSLLVVNWLVVRRLRVLLINWLLSGDWLTSGIAIMLLGTGCWVDVLHLVVGGASRCGSNSWGEWVAGRAVPVEVEGCNNC